MEEVKRSILEHKYKPYCVAYDLLKLQNEKVQCRKLIEGKYQLVFSCDKAYNYREKKDLKPTQCADKCPTELMSKMSTTNTIGDEVEKSDKVDIDTSISCNHWFFGIQQKAYPYQLLHIIMDCLQEMGFVFFLSMS